LIYAYEEHGNAGFDGFLKIGFTNGDIDKEDIPAAPRRPARQTALQNSP
jgi:hypothetical protein